MKRESKKPKTAEASLLTKTSAARRADSNMYESINTFFIFRLLSQNCSHGQILGNSQLQ
jgi:hypothetical protein